MAAPQVQSLADVMGTLDPAYSGQQALITQQQAGLGAKYGAQKTGLEATKVQGFNTINNQATGRGMSFSGIPLDEQATYLSTKYLPGLAAIDQQQNEEDMGLQRDSAKLATDKANQALGIVEGQKKDLNSWNMQQESLAAQARENELNRAAQAREAAANRAAQAAEGAANRAFQASQKAPTGPSNAQVIDSMNAWTKGKTGGDTKLSPSDFKAGYQQFVRIGGGSVADYVAIMNRYINNSHAKDYAF